MEKNLDLNIVLSSEISSVKFLLSGLYNTIELKNFAFLGGKGEEFAQEV